MTAGMRGSGGTGFPGTLPASTLLGHPPLPGIQLLPLSDTAKEELQVHE